MIYILENKRNMKKEDKLKQELDLLRQFKSMSFKYMSEDFNYGFFNSLSKYLVERIFDISDELHEIEKDKNNA